MIVNSLMFVAGHIRDGLLNHVDSSDGSHLIEKHQTLILQRFILTWQFAGIQIQQLIKEKINQNSSIF